MKSLPYFKWTNPVHLLALGFGSGAAPKAPGTFGTLVGVLFYWPMSYLSAVEYVSLVMLMFVVGIYLCGKTAKDFGVHDHGAIVWDEVVGYLIAMAVVPFGLVAIDGVPASWVFLEGVSVELVWSCIGFILFRIFDIWKPWPIKYFDEKVHGGFGIMIDDVLAGFFALVVMALFSLFLL